MSLEKLAIVAVFLFVSSAGNAWVVCKRGKRPEIRGQYTIVRVTPAAFVCQINEDGEIVAKSAGISFGFSGCFLDLRRKDSVATVEAYDHGPNCKMRPGETLALLARKPCCDFFELRCRAKPKAELLGIWPKTSSEIACHSHRWEIID